jgi:hypothetical protein
MVPGPFHLVWQGVEITFKTHLNQNTLDEYTVRALGMVKMLTFPIDFWHSKSQITMVKWDIF